MEKLQSSPVAAARQTQIILHTLDNGFMIKLKGDYYVIQACKLLIEV